MAALRELLGDGDDGQADATGAQLVERAISLAAEDRPRLLAAWLGELAFLAETQGLVPEALSVLRLGEGVIDAKVRARLVASDPLHRRQRALAGLWFSRKPSLTHQQKRPEID